MTDDDEESDDDWEIEETGELIRNVFDVLDFVEQIYLVQELFPNLPLCDLLDMSIAKINSAKFTINNPIVKINSAKLTVFGPANRENLFRENFCP